jgi:hypothetical protein
MVGGRLKGDRSPPVLTVAPRRSAFQLWTGPLTLPPPVKGSYAEPTSSFSLSQVKSAALLLAAARPTL